MQCELITCCASAASPSTFGDVNLLSRLQPNISLGVRAASTGCLRLSRMIRDDSDPEEPDISRGRAPTNARIITNLHALGSVSRFLEAQLDISTTHTLPYGVALAPCQFVDVCFRDHLGMFSNHSIQALVLGHTAFVANPLP